MTPNKRNWTENRANSNNQKNPAMTFWWGTSRIHEKKNHSLFSQCIMLNLKTNDYFKHWHPCTRKIILNLHEFDRFCWINDTSVEVEDTSNCLLAKKVILSLSEVILSTACKIQRQSALFLKCQECKKGTVEPMTCMWIYR